MATLAKSPIIAGSPPHPPKLVIFDFDGTLFDTHDSILHCISKTFSQFQPPDKVPSLDAIRATIASGPGLEGAFRTLLRMTTENATDMDTIDLTEWFTTYRTLYATEGQPLIKSFDKADRVLQELRTSGIPVVVVSNKGKPALDSILERWGLAPLIDLVIGDTPDVPKKPDPSCFHTSVAPLYPSIEARDILVVGDTEADLIFAKNIGARSCWASYGYGDLEECESLGYDAKIEELYEVMGLICMPS
ncbi:HAD-like domain-containing protein [Triangularia verruculosa]|uniref:HAD-like domain-containing protein n=1 Tax=Triangularia verruculosa TaxID=2587418 RepID=A0AAN6XG41_9PEZI|nr:HAD-like domain-containing protein [Triangularia verruculosa]